ncbi:MAG: FG-GAP-like repeat-containing protein [bacterium]
MKRTRLVGLAATLGLVAALGLVFVGKARAVWPPPDDDQLDLSDPQYWPNDSNYGSTWEHFSFIPADAYDRVQAYSPYEIGIGSGVHADRAWQKTIGDRRVMIAVVDSGIRWRERDLVNKYYLNRGELPPPDAGCTGDGSTYDVNGDGFFNVQDYTTNTGGELPENVCDTALLNVAGGWDYNQNGFLDPQDLIAIYSDGIDDDLNGYIDDISGWDVYQNDNDPHDDTDYGHGTGEAEDSAAQGNNGIGDIGVCPECTVLMVRSGESYMTDVNDFAMSVIFGVDSGASLIQSAQGAINNSKFSQDAIDYAWANDVTVVVSAADEDSFHQNFPGSVNHTVYVHSIQHNSSSWREAKTFLNFCNCTNYGAQLLLSTPGASCSSEAVGRTSGIVGLLYSMALKEDVPFPNGVPGPTDKFGARRLRADEVRQLLLGTVDDIHDPNTHTDPERYPTKVGWEARFGYGRTNVGRAVREIEAGRIPPVVDIVTPTWFHVLYPEQTPSVDIIGEISFRDIYDSVDYVIEWAGGLEPDDDAFTAIASGTDVTTAMTGVLASWDISGLTIDNPDMPEPDIHINKHMVTLRIRVTTNSTVTELDGVKAELRKAMHIHRDPDLLPGFPIFLGASGEAPPKTADIDGDGVREIIYLDADGYVHVLKGDGTYVPGFPVAVNLLPHLDPANPQNHLDSYAFDSGAMDAQVHSSFTNTAPAVADLENNGGELEIIVANHDGFVYVYDSAGNVKTGFPVEIDRSLITDINEFRNVDSGIIGSPTVEDMDGDGDYEIIVGAMDGYVYMWHHDGNLDPGYPVQLMLPGDSDFARTISPPSVGDIDGDGSPDIVLGSNQSVNEQGSMWAIHADGNDHPGGPFLEGFPIYVLSLNLLPIVGTGLATAPALADVDGDGRLEFAIAGVAGPTKIYDGDGYLYRAVENGNPNDPTKAFGPGSNSLDMPMQVFFTNPVFADLNNDGRINVLQGGGGMLLAAAMAAGGTRISFDHLLGAWDVRTGRFLYAYPRRMEDYQFFLSPAVADIDGDGLPEAINGSAGYWVHAFNRYGDEPEGWPKFTGGWVAAAPAVGDVDGDGNLDVITGTRNGWLFAWRTTGPATGRVEWESFKHDNRNTGNYHTPLEQGTLELPDDSDIDGDGIPNTEDGDIDGDGILNQDDDDVDGDGIPNEFDFDADGDRIGNEDDDTPLGPIGTVDATDTDKGCGCSARPTRDAGLPLTLLLGLLLFAIRRRQREV